MKMITALVLGLAVASAAAAQPVVRPAPRVAAVNPAVVRQVDPLTLLQSRLTRLEHKVNGLESTISKTQPSLTFACVDDTTSKNSVGVAEDCTPYKCAPIDGRCRVQAKGTDDCASGYNWVAGGDCIK